MSDRRQCSRCGERADAGAKYCPECGAPLSRDTATPRQDHARRNSARGQAVPGYAKVLGAILLLAVVLFGALLVLVLDRPWEGAGSLSPSEDTSLAELQALLRTVGPTPAPAKPTPMPVSEGVLGTWVATRIETNSKKSKEILVDVTLGDYRTTIMFLSDYTASILTDQLDGAGVQGAVRSWYFEGNDVFIDKGDEQIGDDTTMFGRTRFYFKDDLLYSVYTLDGKEVSDFVVYSRSGPPSGEPAQPEEAEKTPLVITGA